MCLILSIGASAASRAQLETAARSLTASALRVAVEHAPRWPWAKPEYIRASISEAGGCACSLLTDEADWEAPYWSLRADMLEPLASMLHGIASAGLDEFTLEALWSGEEPDREEQVSVSELLACIRSGQVGTRTRYQIRPAPCS